MLGASAGLFAPEASTRLGNPSRRHVGYQFRLEHQRSQRKSEGRHLNKGPSDPNPESTPQHNAPIASSAARSESVVAAPAREATEYSSFPTYCGDVRDVQSTISKSCDLEPWITRHHFEEIAKQKQAQRSSSSQDRNGGGAPWCIQLSQDKCDFCWGCEVQFSMLTRRQHCQLCGKIFCNSCCANTVDYKVAPLLLSRVKRSNIRVCDECFAHFTTDESQALFQGASSTEEFYHMDSMDDLIQHARSEMIRLKDEEAAKQLRLGLVDAWNLRTSVRSGSDALELSRAAQPKATGITIADELMTFGLSDTTAPNRTNISPTSPLNRPMSSEMRRYKSYATYLKNVLTKGPHIDEHFLCRRDSMSKLHVWGVKEHPTTPKTDSELEAMPVKFDQMETLANFIVTRLSQKHAFFDEADFRSYIWVETAPHHSESAQESCGQQQTDFDTESTQFQYELWDGVVFRKDLATRKMPRAINWPRVMLIDGSATYVKENHLSRMSRIEQQLEYCQEVCAKVLRANPDIIVLSGSMCFEMLDIFQQVGVAVILRVEREVLMRVSRVTGAIMFDSLDHIETVAEQYWVGTSCSKFYVLSPKASGFSSTQSLRQNTGTMVFANGPNSLFFTVVAGSVDNSPSAARRQPHVEEAIYRRQVTLRREQFLEECDLQGLEFSDPPQTPFSMLSSESNEASRKENAVEFSVVWSVFDRLTIRHRLSHAPSQAGEFTTTALGSKPPRHSHPDSEASLSEDDVSADRGTRHRYHGWEASQFSPPVNARVALYSKDDVPLGQWLLQATTMKVEHLAPTFLRWQKLLVEPNLAHQGITSHILAASERHLRSVTSSIQSAAAANPTTYLRSFIHGGTLVHAFVDVGDTFLQSRDHDRVSVVQPDAGPHDIAIEYPWRAGYEAKSVPIYMWSYCISEQKHQFQRKAISMSTWHFSFADFLQLCFHSTLLRNNVVFFGYGNSIIRFELENAAVYAISRVSNQHLLETDQGFARSEILSIQNMVAFHCAHLRAQLRKQHALSDAPQDAATAVMQGFAQHIRNEKEAMKADINKLRMAVGSSHLQLRVNELWLRCHKRLQALYHTLLNRLTRSTIFRKDEGAWLGLRKGAGRHIQICQSNTGGKSSLARHAQQHAPKHSTSAGASIPVVGPQHVPAVSRAEKFHKTPEKSRARSESKDMHLRRTLNNANVLPRPSAPALAENSAAGVEQALARLETGVNGLTVLVRFQLDSSQNCVPNLISVVGHSLCSVAFNKELYDLQKNICSQLDIELMATHQIIDDNAYSEAGNLKSPSQSAWFAPGRPNNLSLFDLKRIMTCRMDTHIAHSFSSEGLRFQVRCYYSLQFAALRQLTFRSSDSALLYVSSLARGTSWSTSAGKSGSSFFKTLDGRVLFKTVGTKEFVNFKQNALNYFDYLAGTYTAVTDDNGENHWTDSSCLVKIVGLYRIHFEDTSKDAAFRVVAMENLLFGKESLDSVQIFDLKGTAIAPTAAPTSALTPSPQDVEAVDAVDHGIRETHEHAHEQSSGDTRAVYLDSDFLHFTRGLPLLLDPSTDIQLLETLASDVHFLAKTCAVMDYSVLLGVDTRNKEMRVGIIDYLYPYDLLKFMESHGKRMMRGAAPTILHPLKYSKRFLRRLGRYFLQAPTCDVDGYTADEPTRNNV